MEDGTSTLSRQPRAPTLAQCEVVELRRYTLRTGQRDELLAVFEGHLIEPQERGGMVVGGLFTDRDDPDAFVWFRGFVDMEARRRALHRFYDGPVWAQHRDSANATMVDSDNVLLLRRTQPEHALPAPTSPRAPSHALPTSTAWVVVTTYLHHGDPALEAWLAGQVHDVLQTELRTVVAMWRTEPADNTFPRLPVRRVNAVVWTAGFADQQIYLQARHRLETSHLWNHEVRPRLQTELSGCEHQRLQPTSRSSHL